MEERPPIWRVTANILNKQSRTADKEWSSSLGEGWGSGLGEVLKSPHCKNYPVTKCLQIGQVADVCECGNEPSGSTKWGGIS